jgi:hypothetical protein
MCGLIIASMFASPVLADQRSGDVLLDFGSSVPVVWKMGGATIASSTYLGVSMPAGWNIAGVGDFDGNGYTDILWTPTNSSPIAYLWMNGGGSVTAVSLAQYGAMSRKAWVADFNADGKSDILWDFGSSRPVLWTMNGSKVTGALYLGIDMPPTWSIAGVGDFSGNGLADILWTTPSGSAVLWMNNGSGQVTAVSLAKYGSVSGKAWIGDFNGDGKADILWDFGSSKPVLWTMNGSTVVSATYLGADMPQGWQIRGVGDFNADGLADILWGAPGGPAVEWLNAGGGQVNAASLAQYGNLPSRVWTGNFSLPVAASQAGGSVVTVSAPLPPTQAQACFASNTLVSGSVVTPAAMEDQANLCVETNGQWPAYPQEWTWASASTLNQPAAATSGQTRVEQYVRDATTNNSQSTYYTDPETGLRYRLGAVYGYLGAGDNSCDWSTPFVQRYQAAGKTWDGNISEAIAAAATPYQLPDCGPFGYSHKQQSTNSGDLFLVYPAVYSGQINQPHIGESYGADSDPVNNYSALVAAQNAWIAQYQAAANAAQEAFETVPPEPTFVPTTNVTIKGVTINNQRPVILASTASDDLGLGAIYIGCCSDSPNSVVGLTIENIDLVSNNAPPSSVRAGIYINGATNLTLKNMRITGFESAQANGIFSSANTAGTFTLEGIELYHDGGVPDNYAHHVYFSHSVWDANFTIHMLNSWSHDSFAGHLFKSRAQRNILEGNYFQGTLPQNTMSPAGLSYNLSEDYNVDISNGGTLVARNNIFAKTLDDDGTGNGNRIELAYGMEGLKADDNRVNSIDIENNTFVGLNAYWIADTGYYYPLVPMNFSFPPVVPDPVSGLVGMSSVNAAGSLPAVTIPASSIIVSNNAFIGFCGSNLNPGYVYGPDPVADYRGGLSVTEGFSELGQTFSMTNKFCSANTSIIGTPDYSHAAQIGQTRGTSVIGAKD